MEPGTLIREGKGKKILATSNPYQHEVVFKDDITAGDGAKHEVLEGSGLLNLETSRNCFEALNRAGVPTHFINRTNKNTLLVHALSMIPIEVVVRSVATGSYCKRHPEIHEGAHFKEPLVEFFFKNDALHDPLMMWYEKEGRYELHRANMPTAPESFLQHLYASKSGESDAATPSLPKDSKEVSALKNLILKTFRVLGEKWRSHGVLLVDFKGEAGYSLETGALMLGDDITNGSWRLWPHGIKDLMLDKQRFRDFQGAITPEFKQQLLQLYATVAEMTHWFLYVCSV